MLIRALALLLACAGSAAAAAGPEPVRAPLLEFALTDHRGEERRAADLRGRFVLLYFGYTRCPDICPTDLSRLGQALVAMGPVADRIAPVFVDVDPRPTAAHGLQRFAHHFHPRLLALRGPQHAVRAAAASLRARVNVREADGETLIDHPNAMFLVGRDGRLLIELAHWMSQRELVAALAYFTIDAREAQARAGR
jgi:protein SCO1/2